MNRVGGGRATGTDEGVCWPYLSLSLSRCCTAAVVVAIDYWNWRRQPVWLAQHWLSL